MENSGIDQSPTSPGEVDRQFAGIVGEIDPQTRERLTEIGDRVLIEKSIVDEIATKNAQYVARAVASEMLHGGRLIGAAHAVVEREAPENMDMLPFDDSPPAQNQDIALLSEAVQYELRGSVTAVAERLRQEQEAGNVTLETTRALDALRANEQQFDTFVQSLSGEISSAISRADAARRAYVPDSNLERQTRLMQPDIERMIERSVSSHILDSLSQTMSNERIKDVLEWAYDHMDHSQIKAFFEKPPFSPDVAREASNRMIELKIYLDMFEPSEEHAFRREQLLAAWVDEYGEREYGWTSAEAEAAFNKKYASSLDVSRPSLQERFLRLDTMKQRYEKIHDAYPDLGLKLQVIDYGELSRYVPAYNSSEMTVGHIPGIWGSESRVDPELMHILTDGNPRSPYADYLRPLAQQAKDRRSRHGRFGLMLSAQSLFSRNTLEEMSQETGVDCLRAGLLEGIKWVFTHQDQAKAKGAIGFPANISREHSLVYCGVNIEAVDPDNPYNPSLRYKFSPWTAPKGDANCVLAIAN